MIIPLQTRIYSGYRNETDFLVENMIEDKIGKKDIKDYRSWDSLYPERFAPGIVPESAIQKDRFKKYYSDGTIIEWNNLEESNKRYIAKFNRYVLKYPQSGYKRMPKISCSIDPEHDIDLRIKKIRKKFNGEQE